MLKTVKAAAVKAALVAIVLTLGACGGGDGDDAAPPPPSGGGGQPPPPPPPPPPPEQGDFERRLAVAEQHILADNCGATGGACVWTSTPYRPGDFDMSTSTGEAVLIIDDLPRLPDRAFRYRKKIKNFYRFQAGGGLAPAASTWRLPSGLSAALDSMGGPDHIPAARLRRLAAAARQSYAALTFDNVGHGSQVFALFVEANPRQPLVMMDSINLEVIDRQNYCDRSGDEGAQARLEASAEAAAAQLSAMIQREGVRYINYSAGHTLDTVRQGWSDACGGAAPSEAALRNKLQAYRPLYRVLFGSSGVMTAQAAGAGGLATDTPFDQVSADFGNRLRVGYTAVLTSGLDAFGRGDASGLVGWPGAGGADIYVNTGVQPTRPFAYNDTPVLQIDELGLDQFPMTAPQSSWLAPVALSRLIHVRESQFGGRSFDNALIAAVFDAATPAMCPAQQGRCRFQDPMLHGQIEAIRLGYQPARYP